MSIHALSLTKPIYVSATAASPAITASVYVCVCGQIHQTGRSPARKLRIRRAPAVILLRWTAAKLLAVTPSVGSGPEVLPGNWTLSRAVHACKGPSHSKRAFNAICTVKNWRFSRLQNVKGRMHWKLEEFVDCIHNRSFPNILCGLKKA